MVRKRPNEGEIPASIDDDTLMPLMEAIRSELPLQRMAPATPWRWITRGLEGMDGERIRLRVIYCGRDPLCSRRFVRQFLEETTAARLEKMRRTQQRHDDASENDLRAAGLI